MLPNEQDQNDLEKSTRASKYIIVILLILVIISPYLAAVDGLMTQGSWPDWSGFGDYTSPFISQWREFQRGITLWDVTQLLIIPVVLALGVIWFNRQVRKTDCEIAAQRDQTERELAADRIHENALQAYLDRMIELLLEKGLRESSTDDEVRAVARSRTLTVLHGLDPKRKGAVVQFLYESRLISRENTVIDVNMADLREADLSAANLRGANLRGTDLRGAILRWAILRGADLRGVDLSWADLRGANLSGAFLLEVYLREAGLLGVDQREVDLSAADLSGAKLHGTDLRGADLSEVNLYMAILSEADLSGVNLSGADLRGCRNWEPEQLNAAASLEGAKLPEGYTPREQNSS